MGPNDWPEGCINFAVNLVRPVQEGHRKKALYSVLSQTLVFDTLESASSYREFVTQVCMMPLPHLPCTGMLPPEETVPETGTSCDLGQDSGRSPTQSLSHSGL